MNKKDFFQKIKLLELKTRKMVHGTIPGDHATVTRGTGFEFDQLRPYAQGDDIRFIDWKGSAKTGSLLVKQYYEDKNREILICVDVSSSMTYGSTGALKSAMALEVAAFMALLGQQAKDKVSLLLFSDRIEKEVRTGMYPSIHSLLSSLADHVIQQNTKTDIAIPLNYCLQHHFKGIVVIISDFIDTNPYETRAKLVAQRAELLFISCRDAYEAGIPVQGKMYVQDVETGEKLFVSLQEEKRQQGAFFSALQVALCAQEDYIGNLFKWLRRRMLY